jgi:hypothetical protein
MLELSLATASSIANASHTPVSAVSRKGWHAAPGAPDAHWRCPVRRPPVRLAELTFVPNGGVQPAAVAVAGSLDGLTWFPLTAGDVRVGLAATGTPVVVPLLPTATSHIRIELKGTHAGLPFSKWVGGGGGRAAGLCERARRRCVWGVWVARLCVPLRVRGVGACPVAPACPHVPALFAQAVARGGNRTSTRTVWTQCG